ncbi:hypothetical protein LJR220_001664 [Bradyrhizobium sp. LjRoot220]|uniref:hypothetical protein n=1 Tax=Bradyrhizobium sp. LjRoot220 TaxID=3342284 RepID=UPI003ECF1355
MTDHDSVPIVGIHRGVGLHDCQSEERLVVVRKAIDEVFDIADIRKLLDVAGDPCWPPESRIFAGAKLQAIHSIATDRRETRPGIDLEYVRALLAGVNSKQWRDPNHYCSLLDYGRWGAPGTKKPAKRDVPLQR